MPSRRIFTNRLHATGFGGRGRVAPVWSACPVGRPRAPMPRDALYVHVMEDTARAAAPLTPSLAAN